MLPHDIEAERALLGACLLSKDAVAVARSMLRPEAFYVPAHQHAFASILTVAEDGTTPDPVIVGADLAKNELLDVVGGIAYLNQLQSATPATSTARKYAEIVREHADLRRFITLGAELAEAGYHQDVTGGRKLLVEAVDATTPAGDLEFDDLAAVIRGEVPDIVPTMLTRTDGKALIYPGLLHWVMGEPSAGKTWLALLASLAAVRAGHQVLYLDHEGNRQIVGARLRALGATVEDVAGIFYLRPSKDAATIGAAAAQVVREAGVVLTVVDGCAKAMEAEGLDEDRAPDVLSWLSALAWPIRDAGSAVLVLDHVTKDKESRGRWARGNGAKIGEVDGAAYAVEVREPWSRDKAGYSAVRVAKDREGIVGAIGDVVSLLRFAPRGDRLHASLEVPAGAEVEDASTLSDAVLAVLNGLPAGIEVSQARLEEAVRTKGKWRAELIREAAASMAERGVIRLRKDGNRKLFSARLHVVQGEF